MIRVLRLRAPEALYCYVDDLSGSPIPIVLGSYSKKVLEQALSDYPADLFKQLTVRLGWRRYHLALHRDFKLLKKGQKGRKRSKSSDAEYLAELDRDGYAILIQMLWAKRFRRAKTSRHRHRRRSEEFDPVAGRAPIIIDGAGEGELIGFHLVPIGEFHQLGMKRALLHVAASLVLIRMVGPNALALDDYE